MHRTLAFLAVAASLPTISLAQSAGEVERCFQNPAVCGQGGSAAAPSTGGGPVATIRPAAGPDYITVLQSPEPDRKRLQESLRTLDKYNGPIDGDLQSDATVKAIQDWQKGRGTNPIGKLTPPEAQQLNAEASRTPIRRVDPSTQMAATPSAPPAPLVPAPPSNADALKALQARLAERRKAAEARAEAAVQSLVRDLRAYMATDGKGAVGEQFADFAKWYADTKAAGRSVGEVTPVIDDYGDGKVGAVVTSEIKIETRKDGSTRSHCLVFAWIEGSPRKNTQTFSCDDVAGVEKWKTDQALKSAWR